MDYDSFEMRIWRKQLLKLLSLHSFNYSEKPIYKLNCGLLSQFYFDCKKTTLLAEAQPIIGTIVYNIIYRSGGVHAIGGLTLGADPIAISVAYASKMSGNPINAFVVRKQTKDHGTKNRIEGNIKKGMNVAVVDDVITTGASTIEAINACKEADLEVKLVVALIDREEMDGIENIKKLVPDTIALYKAKDFILTNN